MRPVFVDNYLSTLAVGCILVHWLECLPVTKTKTYMVVLLLTLYASLITRCWSSQLQNIF